uniref:Uncharacterized protein n=1 Tax=Globisporangium ultimum (strain ATCC 200006 / CBS 805.95 / DAOM BR144) TaxID=431595 RepID=K3WN54_GLOUD
MTPSDWIATQWTAFVHRLDKLHIERRGNYSVERLYSLKMYCEQTNSVRAWGVLILTPFPCLVCAIAVDLIPLKPPDKGLSYNHLFFVRAACITWYISLAFLHQCNDFIRQVPMRPMNIVVVVSFTAVGLTLATFEYSSAIGWFPLPFYQVFIVPEWLVCLAIGIFVMWGSYFRGNQVIQQQCELTGVAQVAFACLLPTLKLLAKNAINFLLSDEEDGKPKFIIFSVEIFHALYVACCMQHSTSHRTTIVLTVIDFLFTIKSVLNIRSSLQEAEQIILSHPVDRSSRGSTDSRHSITAIKHKNLKLEHVKLALYLLEISPTLAQHDTIRRFNCAVKFMLGKKTNLATPLARHQKSKLRLCD